jgi:hypothetical protein
LQPYRRLKKVNIMQKVELALPVQTGFKMLNREQLKKVMAGACSCTCTGSVQGAWTYNNNAQPPRTTIQKDIDKYCNSAGNCSGCTNIQ